MRNPYRRTVLACYLAFVTQAVSANYVPMLYLTFHRIYGVSFSRLAMISTCFFFTQMVVDFLCARAVDRIGYRVSIVTAQVTSCLGLAGLAFLPDLLPDPFVGMMICVVIYAIGSGLAEVLASPIVQACPFENKEKMVTLLHSFYCWGSVGAIVGSTLFFLVFGVENWRILTLLWALIPLYNIYNFAVCPIEKLVEDGKSMTMGQLFANGLFWIFLVLMVCAGSAELAMAQWASAFAESALGVSKTVGDMAGPCGFAVMMGLSRVLYGRVSHRVELTRAMIASGSLCVICYLLAGFSRLPMLSLIGCAVCGFSVGVMWPGSISMSSKLMPTGGTAMYALLALAGDMGGAVGPAIVGSISQQAGDNLQIGILSGIGFPIVLVLCTLYVKRRFAEATDT